MDNSIDYLIDLITTAYVHRCFANILHLIHACYITYSLELKKESALFLLRH